MYFSCAPRTWLRISRYMSLFFFVYFNNQSFRKRFFAFTYKENARLRIIYYTSYIYTSFTIYIIVFFYSSYWNFRRRKETFQSDHFTSTPPARINLLSTLQLSLISSKNIIERYLYCTTNSYLVLSSANRNTHFQSIF